MSWRSKWEGLWRKQPGIYFSRICDKSTMDNIPDKFRLVIKENTNHVNNNSKTPRFVFAFLDEEEQKASVLKQEDPVIRKKIIGMVEEYKRMQDNSRNYKEKDYAKKTLARKLIHYAQSLSGINLKELDSLFLEKKESFYKRSK